MGIHGAYELISEMGISWFIWRSLYELELRTGILCRRFPPTDPGKALAQSVGVRLDKLDSFLFERWANNEARFFLDPEIARYRAVVSRPDIVLKAANAAKQGRFLFFNHWWAELGDPPDWFINPVTGIRFPNPAHWSQIPDLSPELGDIKYVWEPSRHAQVYYYVRAYALTGDQEYPEAFWRQFEHWVASNPAELGPNWRCGQEIALRSLAWIFGLFAFRSNPATTVRRIALMLQYLWYQARHIEKIHWYAARCVRNNHAISEAAGLFTIGTLFPFLPGAKRWQAKGLRFLTEEAMWQIYEDGTYVQHSMNYARLVVQLFTWCLRVGQVNGVELPDPVRKRLQQLVSFLVSVQDVRTGRVPNYGSNDGALVFPLSSCDYLDYRPALNALSLALTGKKLYEAGPWDEEAAWFCGPNLAEPGPTSRGAGDQSSVTSTTPKEATEQTDIGGRPQQIGRGQAFPVGGYYVLHGPATFGMIRCGRYRHRPSQADMLHLDVWYGGHNVLIDAGTFSYNLPPKWAGYFIGTGAHNTVTVDGKDQMKKGSRFVWTHWVHGRTLRFEVGNGQMIFEGEHQGYAPVTHRRLVVLREDVWVVIDDLFGDSAPHVYTLHWLLGDFCLERYSVGADIWLDAMPKRNMGQCVENTGDEGWHARRQVMGVKISKGKPDCGQSFGITEDQLIFRTACSSEAQGNWARADESGPRGWQSLYYGEKIPAWSYQLRAKGAGPVRFATVLAPADQARRLGVAGSENLSVDQVTALLQKWGIALRNVPGE